MNYVPNIFRLGFDVNVEFMIRIQTHFKNHAYAIKISSYRQTDDSFKPGQSVG